MKTNKNLRAPAVALAGLLVAYGCTKKDVDTPTPLPSTTQTAPDASVLAQARQAWARFVGDVEAGKVRDRTGQYVSKATQVPNGDGTAARPTRAKYDAGLAAAAAGRGAAAGGKGAASGGGASDIPPVPDVPLCDGCGGGGGYNPPPVTSTFVSSEGLAMNGDLVNNPNNYIGVLDLEMSTDSDVGPNVGPHPGHTLLRLDLNKGAGGKYIYLTFARGADMLAYLNPTVYPYLSSTPFLTRFTAQTSSAIRVFIGQRGCPDGYVDVDNGNHSNWVQANVVDLNDGAGGKYIYAYQSNAAWDYTPKYIKEVGVIAGNSSSIQPPAGWVRDNQDLNEGAGGDYIYFCTKYSR